MLHKICSSPFRPVWTEGIDSGNREGFNMKHQFAYAAALAGLMAAVAATPAAASTSTGTFNVTIKITGTCNAVATSTGQTAAITTDTPALAGADINFGSYTAQTGAVAVSGSNVGGASTGVQVTCSKNTPFTVAMAPTNVTSTTGYGTMNGITSGNTDTINYQLYQPTITGSGLSATVGTTASSNVWGNTTGASGNVLSFTGKGLTNTISFPVFATIPAGSLDKFVDRYQDQVTVTLTY